MDSIFITGLWDIKRNTLINKYSNDWKREFKFYTDKLEELLQTGLNIIVYGDLEIKYIVDKYKNSFFIHYPKELFYNLSFFKDIQEIRTSEKWYDQQDAKWLKYSPQAALELYIPIMITKMYLIKKTKEIYPEYNYIYWIDAGITRTHDVKLLKDISPKLEKYDKFIFLSHYYIDNNEIHGFRREGVHRYCNKNFVDRIMKGFFFGGKINNLDEIIEEYNKIIKDSLEEKYLGIEETYNTILINKKPEFFNEVIIPSCINITNSL